MSQNECNCGVEGKGTTQDEDLTQRFQRPKFQRFQKPKTDGESTLGEFRDLYMLQMFFFLATEGYTAAAVSPSTHEHFLKPWNRCLRVGATCLWEKTEEASSASFTPRPRSRVEVSHLHRLRPRSRPPPTTNRGRVGSFAVGNPASYVQDQVARAQGDVDGGFNKCHCLFKSRLNLLRHAFHLGRLSDHVDQVRNVQRGRSRQ